MKQKNYFTFGEETLKLECDYSDDLNIYFMPVITLSYVVKTSNKYNPYVVKFNG